MASARSKNVDDLLVAVNKDGAEALVSRQIFGPALW